MAEFDTQEPDEKLLSACRYIHTTCRFFDSWSSRPLVCQHRGRRGRPQSTCQISVAQADLQGSSRIRPLRYRSQSIARTVQPHPTCAAIFADPDVEPDTILNFTCSRKSLRACPAMGSWPNIYLLLDHHLSIPQAGSHGHMWLFRPMKQSAASRFTFCDATSGLQKHCRRDNFMHPASFSTTLESRARRQE